MPRRATVAEEVIKEIEASIVKHGDTTHPDGTSTGAVARATRDLAIERTNRNFVRGKLTWRDILAEEVFEAFAETDPQILRAELIQVSAMAQKWIADIDGRPTTCSP